MIHLQTVDPFPFGRYPQLKNIWPEESQKLMEEAVLADWSSGSVLYIMQDAQVVGLTGIFFEDNNRDYAFLRWTGIVPYHRGYGIGGFALELIGRMAYNVSGSKYLVELVPDNEYGKPIEAWFRKQGFEDFVGHAVTLEEHDHQKLKPLALNLEKLYGSESE